MEDIYKSQYTGEELDSTVRYLNDSWIQLSVSGGTPGQSIQITSGKYAILTNLIGNTVSLTRYHCTATNLGDAYEDIGYSMMWGWHYQGMETDSLYKSAIYNSGSSNSTYDMDIATQISAIYVSFPVIKNHIYYTAGYADGVLSNGIQFGVSIQEKDSNYIPTIVYGEWTMSPRISSNYRNEQFYSIRCKIENPLNPSFTPGNVHLAYYANKNDATKKRSIIRYSWPVVIDLTASFGEGSEPSKDWCDRNIYLLYNDKTGSLSTVLCSLESGEYKSVTGIFDDNGNCMLNLPGFGEWNICVLNEASRFNIVYFSTITVDAVKRYYADVSFSGIKYVQYRSYQGTTEVIQEVSAKYNAIGKRRTAFFLFKLEGSNQSAILYNIIDPGKTDITCYVYEKLPGDDGTFSYLDYKDQTPVRTVDGEFLSENSFYVSEMYDTLQDLQNYVFFIDITGDYTQDGARIYWQVANDEEPEPEPEEWHNYYAEYGTIGKTSSYVYIYEKVDGEGVPVSQPITELISGTTGLNYKVYTKHSEPLPIPYDNYKNDTPVRNVAMEYQGGNVYKATYSSLGSGNYRMFAVLQPET